MGIDSKLVVVGMTATNFTIADPKDLKPGSTRVYIKVQDIDNPGNSTNEKTSFLVR